MIVRFGRKSSQLADAFLVAVSFWLAFALRANPQISRAGWALTKIPADTLNKDAFLIPVAMISAAPLMLESQGFYNRPVLCPRGAILWPLFKGCALTTIGLMLATFLFQKI